jgi:hypothetical protein
VTPLQNVVIEATRPSGLSVGRSGETSALIPERVEKCA